MEIEFKLAALTETGRVLKFMQDWFENPAINHTAGQLETDLQKAEWEWEVEEELLQDGQGSWTVYRAGRAYAPVAVTFDGKGNSDLSQVIAMHNKRLLRMVRTLTGGIVQ